MYKVSVVTVTFNCRDIIENTILSVISQNYSNMEYIIIDGSSKDGTVDVIRKYNNKIVKWLSEPDNGIFDAMNKSLSYVTGDYVIFMNAGDRFVNNHVISDVFENYVGDDVLIYGDTYVMTKYGYRLRKTDPIYLNNATRRDYVFKGQGICHQSLFTKVDILKRVKFNLEYPLGADYDTTAKVYNEGGKKIKYCKIPVAVFDDRVGGASHYREMMVFKERIKMFNYKPSVVDYCKMYYVSCRSKIKGLLEGCFPDVVGSYRKRKYLNEI